MTKEQLHAVVDSIKGHEVFRRKGTKPQGSVIVQLQVTIQWLAHDGYLAVYESVDPAIGIYVGTEHEYYQSVITAL
ncbi:hypothetical protein BGZ76_005710, partial [Entomortierella beljakovae]